MSNLSKLEKEILSLVMSAPKQQGVKVLLVTDDGKLTLGEIYTNWLASDVANWVIHGSKFTITAEIPPLTKKAEAKK